jgi:hypothetical protein
LLAVQRLTLPQAAAALSVPRLPGGAAAVHRAGRRSAVIGSAKDYWNHHELGTHDRPRPGTRVRIVSAPHQGHTGVVALYEGCWNGTTFPVKIDYVGVTALYTTSCVRVLPDVPAQPVQPVKRLASDHTAVAVAS